ncbi:MAG: threonine--tRNA ligase, partial [Enterococcus hulanensis]
MSNKVEIVLPDGSKQKVAKDTTLFEIKNQLMEEAVVGSIDGELVDLSTPVTENAELAFYDCATKEGTTAICQLVSLLLQETIKVHYPEALFAKAHREDQTIWVDLRVKQPLSALVLKDLEHHIKKQIKADGSIESAMMTVSEAKEVFKDNELKLAALTELDADQTVFVYSFGEATEFFLEPAALELATAKYFSLLKVSGAYWQGKPENEMLQRVTGVVFAEKAQLLAHLDYLEESEKRSHQKLGKELDLFM